MNIDLNITLEGNNAMQWIANRGSFACLDIPIIICGQVHSYGDWPIGVHVYLYNELLFDQSLNNHQNIQAIIHNNTDQALKTPIQYYKLLK